MVLKYSTSVKVSPKCGTDDVSTLPIMGQKLLFEHRPNGGKPSSSSSSFHWVVFCVFSARCVLWLFRCGCVTMLRSPNKTNAMKQWEQRWIKNCLCGGLWRRIPPTFTWASSTMYGSQNARGDVHNRSWLQRWFSWKLWWSFWCARLLLQLTRLLLSSFGLEAETVKVKASVCGCIIIFLLCNRRYRGRWGPHEETKNAEVFLWFLEINSEFWVIMFWKVMRLRSAFRKCDEFSRNYEISEVFCVRPDFVKASSENQTHFIVVCDSSWCDNDALIIDAWKEFDQSQIDYSDNVGCVQFQIHLPPVFMASCLVLTINWLFIIDYGNSSDQWWEMEVLLDVINHGTFKNDFRTVCCACMVLILFCK